jgi:hypothetical protein
MTSAAPLAIRAAPLLFGRVTPSDFQDPLVLAAELSLSACDDCFFRNHPDPDTALSPSRDIHNLTKIQVLTLVASSTRRQLLLLLTDARAREKVADVRYR